MTSCVHSTVVLFCGGGGGPGPVRAAARGGLRCACGSASICCSVVSSGSGAAHLSAGRHRVGRRRLRLGAIRRRGSRASRRACTCGIGEAAVGIGARPSRDIGGRRLAARRRRTPAVPAVCSAFRPVEDRAARIDLHQLPAGRGLRRDSPSLTRTDSPPSVGCRIAMLQGGRDQHAGEDEVEALRLARRLRRRD